ncbi:MAG: enoyl-CoA hydratase [Deinococcota bacterium]|nr:enoyl-CoA hydratase [Deinococcota bacterium]
MTVKRQGAVAQLTLSRPGAHNAITWAMYEQLERHLGDLAGDDTVRAVVVRGDGRHFAAGTDIGQFRGFSGADGVRYEERIDSIMSRLVDMPKPTIAAVQGYAVGAGLIISTCCDLRYATPAATFGAPMARTLGNCLSLKNYRRLAEALGVMRSKELMFTARLLPAQEALQAGFLTAVLEEETFFAEVMEIARAVAQHAPLTILATKEAYRRLREESEARLGSFDDVVERVYGSEDFAEGSRSYLEKRPPTWQGR